MLFGFDFGDVHAVALGHFGQARAVFVVGSVVTAFLIERQEAFKHQNRTVGAQAGGVGIAPGEKARPRRGTDGVLHVRVRERDRLLHELVEMLKRAPDAVIYYHTHRFLEVHHYLTPEPANDFSFWISDALGDDVLAEKLASVDTFGFPNLGALKERLVGIIEEHLSAGSNLRESMPGRDFYFAKSVSVILPTPYVAHDLREFTESLRKIGLGALYFHVFESRLRLGRGLNDFSTWMQDSLGESELGEEIARLDPYTYTLEGLRLSLIQLIEKRIK